MPAPVGFVGVADAPVQVRFPLDSGRFDQNNAAELRPRILQRSGPFHHRDAVGRGRVDLGAVVVAPLLPALRDAVVQQSQAVAVEPVHNRFGDPIAIAQRAYPGHPFEQVGQTLIGVVDNGLFGNSGEGLRGGGRSALAHNDFVEQTRGMIKTKIEEPILLQIYQNGFGFAADVT